MTSRPVVSCGRYPAKAVVGEVVPVTATVWREGHDAVAATLVVRYHGTGIRSWRRSAGSDAHGRRRCRSTTVVGAAQRVKPHADPDVAGHEPDVFHGAVHARTASDCGRSGWTAGAIRSRTWRKDVTAKLDAGQSESELSNDLLVGAQAARARRHRRAAQDCATR